ncbi:hypothetical protein LCGC14_2838910, partial [marine sediment metagenome]
MKHYKYRKVNPEILKEMKQLRKGGLSYKKIAENVNTCDATVQY